MNLIRKNQVTQFDPFNVIADLQEDLNRFFSGSLRRARDHEFLYGLYSPEIELKEENDQYVLKADLPGLNKDEIQLNFTGNVLEIKGERKEETERKEKGFYHSERRYGSFARVVEFPTEVQTDKAKASYKDGVLELVIPKSEASKPKQIKIDLK